MKMEDNAFNYLKNEISDEMSNMYLTMKIGDEVYGIEIRYVVQIVGMQEITSMPEMPSYMKGYINIRGSIIPVVSMRSRFGKFEEEFSERTCIVIVNIGDKEIGLIVDAICETLTIEPDRISPAPDVSGSASPYIMGIAHMGNGDATAVLIYVQKLFEGYSF